MATTIQDKMVALSAYNPNFNIFGGQSIVRLSFPSNWKVLKSSNENVKVTADDNDKCTYFYYASVGVDFNEIFDCIDETVSYNNEIAEKSKLFKEKVSELKELFLNEDLQTLSTLEFKLRKKVSRKKVDKTTDDDTDANETNEKKDKEEAA